MESSVSHIIHCRLMFMVANSTSKNVIQLGHQDLHVEPFYGFCESTAGRRTFGFRANTVKVATAPNATKMAPTMAGALTSEAILPSDETAIILPVTAIPSAPPS